MRRPTESSSPKSLLKKLSELVQDEGYMGILPFGLCFLKKMIFTFWYRLRLKTGAETFFTGPIHLRGARYIEIGSHCVVEEGAVLWAKKGSQLRIGNRCLIGTQCWLNADGFLEIADGTYILKGSEIVSAEKIVIGPEAWIARDCKISGRTINIGEGVIVGPAVSIISGDHEYDASSGKVLMRAENRQSTGKFPIVLKSGSWIGTRSVILKGVQIGSGVIIGAGAVVTKDIPDHHLALGVPAHVVKKLTDHQ